MYASAKLCLTRLLALLIAVSLALPATGALAQSAADFSQQELDQMLAPIALYPDSLLSQITMAATYPLEVVEAARWSAANRSLRGERAVRAVEGKDWDPAVKSLVAFPQILRMMSDKLEWTEQVGDAFLGQERQVMDTVQDLRHRAYSAGNLRSNEQARIDSQGDYISINQTDSQYAYEPYYNPRVVYGSWWWPQSQPVYWAQWPGYRERPGFGGGFAWGAGIALGAEFFFGAFDWNQHRVNVVNVNNYYYPRDTRAAPRAPRVWEHEVEHRRGTPYRAPAVRAKYNQPASPAEARRDYRGRLPSAAEPRGTTPATATAPGNRPDARNGRDSRDNRNDQPSERGDRNDERRQPQGATAATGSRTDNNDRTGNDDRTNTRTAPAGQSGATRPDAIATRPVEAPVTPAMPARPVRPVVPAVVQQPHVLENVGHAAEARNASARGRASREAAAQTARPAPVVTAPAVTAPSTRTRTRAVPPAAAPHTPDNARDGKGKGRDEK